MEISEIIITDLLEISLINVTKRRTFFKHLREGVFESWSRWHNKSKVSVQKILKIFGNLSFLNYCDRKWKLAWLVIIPKKHSWYVVERYYWKSSAKVIPVEGENIKVYWLEDNLYYLPTEDKQILLSPTAWLNNNIADAAQELICEIVPYRPVNSDW